MRLTSRRGKDAVVRDQKSPSDLNATMAGKVGVRATVHDKDSVYWYCATRGRHTAATGINHYIQDGGLPAVPRIGRSDAHPFHAD